MKKLLILALFALAAWQTWLHYPALLQRRPAHEAVIDNVSGRTMERIRLEVGGQSFVKETLESGQSAVFPFRIAEDATFKLVWGWSDSPKEESWNGGLVPRGPMVQRHTITVEGDGGVIYRAEAKTGS